MNANDPRYLELHTVWRSEIMPTEDVQIDETVFEEIYRLQEKEEQKEWKTKKC